MGLHTGVFSRDFMFPAQDPRMCVIGRFTDKAKGSWGFKDNWMGKHWGSLTTSTSDNTQTKLKGIKNYKVHS